MADSCSIETWPGEAAAAARRPDHQAAAVAAPGPVAHPHLGLPARADHLLHLLLVAQANLIRAVLLLGPDQPKILPRRPKLRLTTTATTEDMRAAMMSMIPMRAVVPEVEVNLLALGLGSLSVVAAAVLFAL